MNYKDYRNLLSTIFKKSRKNCHNNYFEFSWNNIKNSWKDLKSIFTVKNISADIPNSLFVSESAIFNPMAILNVFNNYFF